MTSSDPTIGTTFPSSIRASSSSQVRCRHAPAAGGRGVGADEAVPGSMAGRCLRATWAGVGYSEEITLRPALAPPSGGATPYDTAGAIRNTFPDEIMR